MGRKYRDEILAPGGTRDSMESLKAFLGRPPKEEPFLEKRGLIWKNYLSDIKLKEIRINWKKNINLL